MTDREYRDELAAAHARIAELERRLAEARGGGVDAAPWIEELEAKRAAVIAEGMKGLGDPARRWRVRGYIVGAAIVIASVLALLTGSAVPFLICGFFTLHPGMLIVWATGQQRERKTKTELAKIDEKIADVKRMAQMMGAAHVRVDAGAAAAGPRARVGEEVDLDAASRRGTTRRA